MTVTVAEPAPNAVGPGTPPVTADRPPASRRRRRWPRIVGPLSLVAVFWLGAIAAHAYQDPNFADPGTLSPLGTGRHGASQLAQMLRGRGITIERVTSTSEAIEAARGRDATILVPAPDLLDGRLVYELVGEAGQHDVVLIKPGYAGRLGSGLLDPRASSRWATGLVEPGCSADAAQRAGAALVHRDSYTGLNLTLHCYGGSLVGGRLGDVQVVAVGATEPFRNDRIAEAGNAALATGLLDTHELVVWVDVHRREPPVPPDQVPFPRSEYERGEQDRTRTGNALLDAFPVQLWSVFVLLVVAGAMLAIARARRLGPPVAEPLPVIVPAAEVVTGRGRLYGRIHAQGATLQALRAGALARLARAVDPTARAPERGLAAPGPQRDAFVRTIATRAGLPEAMVATILFGPLPTDDAALVTAAAELDRLVAAVLAPRQTRPDPPG